MLARPALINSYKLYILFNNGDIMGRSIVFLKKLKFLYSVFHLFYRRGFFISCLLFCAVPSEAVKIHFPDEELAMESVLPLIDPPKMVLNRNVPLKFRAEIGVGMGFGLDEPFYYPFYPSFFINFNFTEVQAISFTGTYFFPWLSGGGDLLKQGVEGIGVKGEPILTVFDALKAPYPQMSAFLNYQYSPFYGKISLAKNWVMNLSIYGFAGLGVVVSNNNDHWPAGNLGIGQKLYINKWLGIRWDLGFYAYHGPVVENLKLDEDAGNLKYPQIQTKDKGVIINVLANMGLIILI